MKKTSLFIFKVFFLAGVLITIPQGYAFAQEPVCTDATGGVIPCPPPAEIPCGEAGGPACPSAPSEDDNNDNGNPAPVRPTRTPLSITDPDNGETRGEQDWKGTCSSKNKFHGACVVGLKAACTNGGGTPSTEVESNGDYSVTCSIPDSQSSSEPTSQPLAAAPDDTETAKATWSGSCSGTNTQISQCIGQLAVACENSKGTYEIDITKTEHTLTCTLPSSIDTELPSLASAATSTPLPDENHLGQCTEADGDFSDCAEQFKCEDGLLVIIVDLYSGNGTVYDFYCIPDENIPQLDLPITLPADGGAEDNWTGGCAGGDGLDTCLDLLSDSCTEEGGDVSIWYDDDGGAGVYCENQSEANPPALEETPMPVAAPTDNGSTEGKNDWDEECSWATCWAVDLACWMDGGSGYAMEDGAGNLGYHCSIPDSNANTAPPTPWGPLTIAGTIIVVLIGMLLPAVQKVREAAARSSSTRQTKEHILLNKDGDSSSARMPNIRNPELTKNQDEAGTEASDHLLDLQGIKGESKGHIKKAKLFVRKAGNEQADFSPDGPQDIGTRSDGQMGWDVKHNKKL